MMGYVYLGGFLCTIVMAVIASNGKNYAEMRAWLMSVLLFFTLLLEKIQ